MMNASAVGGDDDDEDDEGFEDDDRALLGEEGMEDSGGGGGEEGAEGSSGVMTMAQHERIRQASTTSNGPTPVASGSGSGSSAGKKVVEGKGKQAVVAAKAREKRNGSVSDNGTIEPPLPPQSQSRPPSNESPYSSQPPQPPNYPPPYPPTSSNSNPSSEYPPYSLPPPSNPHNQQPNPYSFLSGFPPPPNQYAPQNHFPSQFPQHPPHQHPHGLPPPPNPADLFSMGLFGNAPPPPGMIPNNNSSSQNGGGGGGNPMNFFGGPQGGGGNFNFGGGPPGGYPNPFGSNFPMPGMNGYPSSSSAENSSQVGGGGVPNWFGSSNPMLAALAQQQRAEATAHWHQQRQSLMIDQNPGMRPVSRTSNSRQSPEQPQQQRAPSRQDSNGSTSASKPRLIVAIPKESNVEEGRKKGLVTAGGASILGRGFEGKGEGKEVEENTEKEGEGRQDEEDEESQVRNENPLLSISLRMLIGEDVDVYSLQQFLDQLSPLT